MAKLFDVAFFLTYPCSENLLSQVHSQVCFKRVHFEKRDVVVSGRSWKVWEKLICVRKEHTK